VEKGRSLQMTDKNGFRYPNAFRAIAVDRFRHCENVGMLAKELGLSRHTLYRWRAESERAEARQEPTPERLRDSRQRREISNLKRLVAEKTLELDFFRGALQKIDARHRGINGSGELVSSTISGT
jgi:hypothetical protein